MLSPLHNYGTPALTHLASQFSGLVITSVGEAELYSGKIAFYPNKDNFIVINTRCDPADTFKTNKCQSTRSFFSDR